MEPMMRPADWRACGGAKAASYDARGGEVGAGRVPAIETDSDVVTAEKLEGKVVRGADGEPVGRVKHVVLDLAAGRIAFLVVCLEGPDRRWLCAIPWIAFEPEAGSFGPVLGYTREDLRAAPAFRADDWPEFGDPAWLRAVFEFFAQPPRRSRQLAP